MFLFFAWFPLLCKKVLNLIRSHLFDFAFITMTLRDRFKKKFADIYVSVLHLFSTMYFIVSGLAFRCLTHFEFIFVCGVRECCNFILFHLIIHLSQHHLLKRPLHSVFFPPLL